MRAAVLAPGPTLPGWLSTVQEGGYTLVVAVNDSYRIAPWVDILVAQDIEWWVQHPAAMELSCERYSTNVFPGVQQVVSSFVETSTNSGLCAMEVARQKGATEIDLYGFTMDGTHFHGLHPSPLPNTQPARLLQFQAQFNEWFRTNNVRVRNMEPSSALRIRHGN